MHRSDQDPTQYDRGDEAQECGWRPPKISATFTSLCRAQNIEMDLSLTDSDPNQDDALSDINRRARTALGGESVSDWQLTPSTHAGKFHAEAGALARVLRAPELNEIVQSFEQEDRLAVAKQASYKFYAGWSAILSLIAVLFVAILIVLQPTGVFPSLLVQALVLTQGVALATSFIFSLILAHTGLFASWMAHRANAEFWRIDYFARVMDADEQHRENELPLLPLQLEYFCQYHLDVQRLYYTKRGQQHARVVLFGTVLRWLALVLVAVTAALTIANGIGVDWQSLLFGQGLYFSSLTTEFQQRMFISLSTTGAALQGWLAARDLMNQDARNSVRYAATRENLEALTQRPLEEARSAAASGDQSSVLHFSALVNEQISSEHREWIDLRTVVPNLSLDRLADRTLPHTGTRDSAD